MSKHGLKLIVAAALTGGFWLHSAAAVAQQLPRALDRALESRRGAMQDPGTGSSASGGSAASIRQEQRRQADLVKAVLDEIEGFRPDPRAFSANNDQAQADAIQALQRFRERMAATITADLIAMAADSSNSYATRVASAADRHAASTARAISGVDLDRFRSGVSRDETAVAQYFLLIYRVEQMRQLARLYPQSQAIAEASQTADAALAELGTLESVIEDRGAAQAARIAERRLSPAVRRDPAAERDLAAAFTASVWTQGEFAGSEILRVNLTSPDWTVRRNPVTGVILSRDQGATLGVRRRDGKCFSYAVVFEQSYQGSGYGGTRMASGRELEMLCENIVP